MNLQQRVRARMVNTTHHKTVHEPVREGDPYEPGRVQARLEEFDIPGSNQRVLQTVKFESLQKEFSLGLHQFTPTQREWLFSVVSRQLADAYRAGFEEGRDNVRHAINAALNR